MYRILIVEDDAGIAEAVSEQAKMWNFETHSVTNFRNVMAEFAEFDPHLVLMDIGLPFFNGYYWCGEIRKVSRVPVIFISSASDNMNIVMAMNMGGDDFIAKPFDQTVLIAKMQAMLRRTYDFAKTEHVLQCREAVLNVDDHSLTYRGEQIALSRNEYGILKILMENTGKIVSRERLMERLWETDSFIDDNTLTVNVNRLRKKLEGAGLRDFITTKFGVGYVIFRMRKGRNDGRKNQFCEVAGTKEKSVPERGTFCNYIFCDFCFVSSAPSCDFLSGVALLCYRDAFSCMGLQKVCSKA